MNKKLLNETEICDAFITPAIIGAGWDQRTQIRREYTFTDGRVIVRGKLGSRGKKKRADYLLFYQSHLPLAVAMPKPSMCRLCSRQMATPFCSTTARVSRTP